MVKKQFYIIPDLKVRELRNRGVLCASINQIGYHNERLTEDDTEYDYD